MSSQTQDKIKYSSLRIPTFAQIPSCGRPALPQRGEFITVPSFDNLKLEITNSEYIDIEGYEIAPAQPIRFEDEDYDGSLVVDDNMYQKDDFYPQNIISLVDTFVREGVHIARVQIYPVQYNPVKRILRCYPNIRFKLNHEYNNSVVKVSARLANLVSNKSVLSTDRRQLQSTSSCSYAQPVKMIVVTTDALKSTLTDFLEWKRLLGIRCRLISKASWTSSQEVQDSINNCYNNNYVNAYLSPEYLMIVGDNSHVPYHTYNAQTIIDTQHNDTTIIGTHYGDFSYGCVYDSDSPDMTIGRIPSSNVSQLSTALAKIIQYERNPPTDNTFYNHACHVAHFEDKVNNIHDGEEDRRFVYTSEEIRNYVQSEVYGMNIDRLYYADSIVYPRYYSSRYSYGDAIPNELRKDVSPFYAWNATWTDLYNAFNSGGLYILYRGHGAVNGWHYPRFTSYLGSHLENGSKLPILFSITCNTGYYSYSDCFASKMLFNNNGGAVGVFAASNASLSGYNDVIAVSMFNSLWPSQSWPNFSNYYGGEIYTTPTNYPIYEMGLLLNSALQNMDVTYGFTEANLEETSTYNVRRAKIDYEKHIFHYFGDPSMQMYTAKPYDLSLYPSVSRASDGTLTVASVDPCTMIVSSADDAGASYYQVEENTSSTTFTGVPEHFTVTMKGHNFVPYVYTSNAASQAARRRDDMTDAIENLQQQTPASGRVIHIGNGFCVDANGRIFYGK